MADLTADIEAYESLKAQLESSALGKWVVVKDLQAIGTYDSFEAAAQDAVRKFGRGPYLIRQIGALPVPVPASVMYRFA